MTRMVPPRVHPRTPSSEQRVFDMLRRAEGTETWWALHSLALSKRGDRPFGEVDFVVGIPGSGIMIVEVKGGRIVVEEGEWRSTSKDGVHHRLSRSPFAQARDAAFAVRAAIQDHFGEHSDQGGVIIGSLVIFPDSVAPPGQPSFERWELLDYHDLKGGNPKDRISDAMSRTVDRVSGESRRRLATGIVLSEVREFLRPDFDGAIPRAAQIRDSEERILRLTREQFSVLDMFKDNDRCLIRGGAGTGKTVLALEDARRSGSRGERTLLLCFNRPLAESLRSTLAAEGIPKVEAATCHSFLRSRILESEHCEEFREKEKKLQASRDHETLFSEIYPLYGHLAALESDVRYERLIIDEAQDLIRPQILSALSEWLDGGLTDGRWAIYGDFDNQAIYSGSEAEVTAGLESLINEGSPTKLRLSKNFRNSPSIGYELTVLCGFEKPPFEIADAGATCLAVNYLGWDDLAHQAALLTKELQKLLDSGVPHEDIVILSPNRMDRSAASLITGLPVTPLESPWPTEGQIGFSTVHRFKGLESPVILLCDVESITDASARSLLYVGMSRAKSYLAVALSPGARREARERTRIYLQREQQLK